MCLEVLVKTNIANGSITLSLKMTMWADNVKFVKDILDSKYQKIDSAVLEVLSNKKCYFRWMLHEHI